MNENLDNNVLEQNDEVDEKLELVEDNSDTEKDETVKVDDGAQSETETDEQKDGQENEEHEENQNKKMFTQEELDNIVASRVARVKRDYQKQNKEYEGLINTLKAGLGKDNIKDINSELVKFYSEQGIQIPEMPKYDEYEEKILAKAYADELIQNGEEDMLKEANRIAMKPFEKRTVREIEILNILGKELTERKEINDLKTHGQDTSILSETKFKEFRTKLNPKISVSEAIDMYSKLNPKKITTPPNPGSATSKHTESKIKDFYTSEEVDALDSKDLDNPKVLKAVMASMEKWGK